MLAFVHNYWLMLVARSLMAICYAVVTIVAIIYLSKSGSAKNIGVFLSALAGASVCANVLGGTLADMISYTQIFEICIVLLGIALFLFTYFFKDEKTEEKKTEIVDKSYLKNMRLHLFAICANMPYRIVITGFILYLLPVILNEASFSNLIICQLFTIFFLFNWLTVKTIAHFLDKYIFYY